MTIEQLQGIAWLILGIIFGVAIVYSMRRQKYRFPTYKVWLLVLLIGSFVVRSFEGDAIGALFVWFSCIIGLSLAFDIFESQGKMLNEKPVLGSLLFVTVVGGTLTNVYIFSMPTSVAARIFSLSVLILVTMPILFALIAYLMGKRNLSKKLLGSKAC